MAIKIDNDLLQQLGLASLPDAEKNALLKHIYETLEMRVGMRLADQMSNEQLDEFEQYFEAKDDAGAFKWLETNFPNYKEIVQQEFEKLKGEIAQSAGQIVAASQQAVAPQPVQQQPQYQQSVQQPQYGDPQQYQQPQAPMQPQPGQFAAPQQQPPVQPQQQPIQPQPQQPQYPQSPYPQAPQPQQPMQPQYPSQQPPAGPGATQQ